MIDKQHYDKIKRIIRNLKKAEIRIRFGSIDPANKYIHTNLVWSKFFELKIPYKGRAKYNLDQLIALDKQELDKIVEEFYYNLFYQFINRYYSNDNTVFDPELLSKLGLPSSACIDDIKKRFRQLAKEMHPDAGGGHEEFIALNQLYQKLRE